ncbi:peptide chain release factor N(5)-glutamine methyltransferase [Hufsiella ginkgonis]|uniref:Release factor glutamine methyltransferase n=1 Tax=Hufsiella ginkgonis TaxID=2695274 RepID=A0A7K1XWX0_9SPHI|nr:peptide chain release factor N(5)-glutamine methyltransferase [Hufsiella ginkgonis]MXV15481.1 peptide chain release factor N(5)-glutamine methyltransferase [Hufsiella ginkgonis]
MTLATAERLLTDRLLQIYDPVEAASLAQYALEHVCSLSRPQLLINRDRPLSLMEETSLAQMEDGLLTGKPIQYIIGEAPFYGLTFKVTPAVLIPRPETEELVDWIRAELSANRYQLSAAGYQPLTLLDIGTGSGCIAISLKKHLPHADVWANDISFDALEVALYNSVKNKAEVRFLQGDMLSEEIDRKIAGRQFSMIVSNPPYIAEAEKDSMHRNVLDFEPHTALFVDDPDPLLFYRRITALAVRLLVPGGLLFFEINEAYGEQVVQLISNAGFASVQLKKDMMGRARMVRAAKL